MISLQQIQFSYGKHPILNIAELDFRESAITGILGPNGAGKTTLLKLIAGILTATHGNIFILGKQLPDWDLRALAQAIAYVPQETTASFPMCTMDLVLLGRMPFAYGFGFASQKDMSAVEDAMRQCDVWEFRNRLISELSGGERQRVILARALAQTPHILLLDEPTTFLDIRHQTDVVRILRNWVTQSGGSVIAVLHDLNLAAQICNHVVLLKAGSVHAAGPTDDTLSYSNVCTAFDADVYVGINELTGRPYFVPM